MNDVCKKHPRYQGRGKPTGDCTACWIIYYRLRQWRSELGLAAAIEQARHRRRMAKLETAENDRRFAQPHFGHCGND